MGADLDLQMCRGQSLAQGRIGDLAGWMGVGGWIGLAEAWQGLMGWERFLL